MKKLFTIVMATFALTFGFNHAATAQVEQGSIIIDPYYGYPNFGKSLIEGLISDSAENVSVVGIGPAGLRAEYLISDNFGVGFDFIYNSAGADYDYKVYNSDGITYNTYTGTILMQRIRVQLRMNYHFVQTDVVDAYVGFGAGTNIRLIDDKSTEPGYVPSFDISGSLIPVSVRIALGSRFYFTENIGINAELGLGGPVISGGVSIKF